VTVVEYFKRLNSVAPKSISDEYCAKYGGYDNSGVLIDTGEDVKKALFSLDLTESAIKEAKKIGANLIVTHHPAIYAPIRSVSGKLADCIKAGISVISMHLNLDGVEGGIDESLSVAVARACGGKAPKGVRIAHALTGGGYGRAYDVPKVSKEEFVQGLQRELVTDKVWLFGNGTQFARVASFCGAGVDDSALAFAVEQNADAVVSADWKHHQILAVLEAGMTAVQVTHYASEAYGFKKYYEKMSRERLVVCAYHEDGELL
jgi:dinuclear metal center YbgI/SA1388 family protein